MKTSFISLGGILPALAAAACIPSGDQTAINAAFKAGGAGTLVELCQKSVFTLTETIAFTANNQELRTEGNSYQDRALLQPAKGSSLSTLIESQNLDNITIQYLSLNGTRSVNGPVANGGATIKVGGKISRLLVSDVQVRESRGTSGIHFYGDNDCKGVVLRSSNVGAAKDGDGVKLQCTDSYIYANNINGVAGTGSGIAILGAAGSTVHKNFIQSSHTEPGRAGISMTDPNSSYEDVYVINNDITGVKLLHTGIAIGSRLFPSATGDNQQPFAKGPAIVTGNGQSGHTTFLVAINGWTGGLNASDNGPRSYHKHFPASLYVDSKNCDAVIQDAVGAKANYTYWPQGVTGPLELGNDFLRLKQEPKNFDCAVPDKRSFVYKRGQMDVSSIGGGLVADFYGTTIGFASTGLVLIYYITGGDFSTGPNVFCRDPAGCRFKFDNNGDLNASNSTHTYWSLGTGGKGETLECLDTAPFMRIRDISGKEIWNTGYLPQTL